MKTWLTAAPLALAVAAALFLLVVPVYSGFDGNRTTHATLVAVNGPWAIIPVMVPVVIALAALVFPRLVVRIIATIVLCGFTLISGFTIGLFYLPAALAMLMVTCARLDHVRR